MYIIRVVQNQRNNEFKDQINSLYLRYETGTERLKIAMNRTLIEKINYNNYLIKVYPNEYSVHSDDLGTRIRRIYLRRRMITSKQK